MEVMGLCSNPSLGILSCTSSSELTQAVLAAQSDTARTGQTSGVGPEQDPALALGPDPHTNSYRPWLTQF